MKWLGEGDGGRKKEVRKVEGRIEGRVKWQVLYREGRVKWHLL